MLPLKSFSVQFSDLIRIELLNIIHSLKTMSKKEHAAIRLEWSGDQPRVTIRMDKSHGAGPQGCLVGPWSRPTSCSLGFLEQPLN